MKKLSLSLLLAFFSLTLAHAQTQILTVDLARSYQEYQKAQQAESRLKSMMENAQQDMRGKFDEGRSLLEDYRALQDKARNPGMTEDARKEAADKAMELGEEIRRKESELDQYRKRTEKQLGQRRQEIFNLHVQEIRDVVQRVAQQRGADLVLNTSGPFVVHSNDSMDITDEVIGMLNANQ